MYGLPRICDWQDQALLIERVGRTNALLLREQFFIRGAIAARRFALQKFGPPEQKPLEKEPEAEQKPEGSSVQTPEKASEPPKNPDVPDEDALFPGGGKLNLATGSADRSGWRSIKSPTWTGPCAPSWMTRTSRCSRCSGARCPC